MTEAAAPASPTRVAIVDDHPVLREGTAALLAAQPGLEIVGVAGSVEEAETLLATTAIDVVLLDIRLGTDSGLRLLSSAPADARPAVVVLTSYDYPQYADAAMRLGASGFVLKTAPITELIDAIRIAAAGGMAFGRRPVGAGAAQRARARRRPARGRGPLERRDRGAAGDRGEDGRVAPAPAVRAARRRVPHGAGDAGAPRGLAGRAAGRRDSALLRGDFAPTEEIGRSEPSRPGPEPVHEHGFTLDRTSRARLRPTVALGLSVPAKPGP